MLTTQDSIIYDVHSNANGFAHVWKDGFFKHMDFLAGIGFDESNYIIGIAENQSVYRFSKYDIDSKQIQKFISEHNVKFE